LKIKNAIASRIGSTEELFITLDLFYSICKYEWLVSHVMVIPQHGMYDTYSKQALLITHCCFYLVWTICWYKFAIFDTTLLWILLLEALQQKGGFKLMFNSSINRFIDPLR